MERPPIKSTGLQTYQETISEIQTETYEIRHT